MDMLDLNAHQGLEALIRVGVVSPTPSGLASFIDNASKHRMPTRIISRMLTPSRFEGVLSSEVAWKAAKPTAVAYLSRFDFDGLTVVEALRTVLLKVSAPTSTRSVSFLLRMTSAQFYRSSVLAHPTGRLAAYFPSHDSVYLLMYGCFILNNDVHSKALKQSMKMTRARFIQNHTSTPGLEAVSPDYLGQLYDDIQKQALPLKGWDAPELGMSGNTLLKAAATAVNTVRLGACTLFSRLFQ